MPETYDSDLSPVDPPDHDPDVDSAHEDVDVECGALRDAAPTEQTALDRLDPTYREVD